MLIPSFQLLTSAEPHQCHASCSPTSWDPRMFTSVQQPPPGPLPARSLVAVKLGDDIWDPIIAVYIWCKLIPNRSPRRRCRWTLQLQLRRWS